MVKTLLARVCQATVNYVAKNVETKQTNVQPHTVDLKG